MKAEELKSFNEKDPVRIQCHTGFLYFGLACLFLSFYLLFCSTDDDLCIIETKFIIV